MERVARRLTDAFDGFLQHKEYLIHDRSRLELSEPTPRKQDDDGGDTGDTASDGSPPKLEICH